MGTTSPKNNFCLTREPPEKRDKKIPKDLFQVHHQKNQDDLYLARLLQATSETLKPVAPLALAEFSLNCIPFP